MRYGIEDVPDVSIIMHQYELKKDDPCSENSKYPWSQSWDDLYPEYNQIGVPTQYFFLRGWHERHNQAEPEGLATAGSNGAELAAAVIERIKNAKGRASVALGVQVMRSPLSIFHS
jgi:hypothetical protein